MENSLNKSVYHAYPKITKHKQLMWVYVFCHSKWELPNIAKLITQHSLHNVSSFFNFLNNFFFSLFSCFVS
jgi:hypothetical protein